MRGGFSKNVNNNGVLTDLPFEENNINAFKYSKEYMLSLYKPSPQLPSDFQQHEYVTVEESLPPLAFDELTEIEKKVRKKEWEKGLHSNDCAASCWTCSCRKHSSYH